MYAKKISEIENLIQKQDEWRCQCINLIASENVMSQRARAAGCSDFAHRYAEGHPGERYYRGTSYIDEIESQLKTNLKIIFVAGAVALQINTGGECHLDAVMLAQGISQIDLSVIDLLIVENVGNLVCPASFQLGTHKNILVASIPERDV